MFIFTKGADIFGHDFTINYTMKIAQLLSVEEER